MPDEFAIRPSERAEEWRAARAGLHDAGFLRLLDEEPPGAVLFESHRWVGELIESAQAGRIAWEDYRRHVLWEMENMEKLRARLGWRQRELDLELLGYLRRRGELSAVLGAGATKAAGGPDWPELVLGLVEIALGADHEIAEVLPAIPGVRDQVELRKRRVPVPPLGNGVRKELVELTRRIRAGEADTEALKRGAQACVDVFGQRAFTHVTELIYAMGDEPGPIHQAVAYLGSLPNDPGWRSIVTYNFDSLAADALLDKGIGVDNYVMQDDELFSRRVTPAEWPNAPVILPARERFVPVYYLHGFTPSYAEDITRVRFVFSAQQYEELYEPERITIVGHVLNEYLSPAASTALFVGCSFDDDVMNGLILRAGGRRYGRMHYALLRWPEERGRREPTYRDMNRCADRYMRYGIRPVWFDRFDDIPEILRRLE